MNGEPPSGRSAASLLQSLKVDPSLRFTESGRSLLRWLFRHTVDQEQWAQATMAVPPHCSYMVAAMARTWAAEWTEFAQRLEQRALTDPQST